MSGLSLNFPHDVKFELSSLKFRQVTANFAFLKTTELERARGRIAGLDRLVPCLLDHASRDLS